MISEVRVHQKIKMKEESRTWSYEKKHSELANNNSLTIIQNTFLEADLIL